MVYDTAIVGAPLIGKKVMVGYDQKKPILGFHFKNVKEAVTFYLRYQSKRDLLRKENNLAFDKWLYSPFHADSAAKLPSDEEEAYNAIFNAWLFRFAFSDVIIDED